MGSLRLPNLILLGLFYTHRTEQVLLRMVRVPFQKSAWVIALGNTTDGSGSVDYPGKFASLVLELEEFAAQIANNSVMN